MTKAAKRHAKRLRRRRKSRRGFAKILVVAGGTFQPAAALRLDADMVVYVDVASELESAKPDDAVVTVALAPGETLRTLAASSPYQSLQDLGSFVSANLNMGLSQLRVCGKAAVDQLLADKDFHQLLVDQVLDQLLVMKGGLLLEVEITVLSSGAGGTGGPAANRVASAMSDVILSHSDATTVIEIFRVGSLTYVGLGDRVHRNFAATLAEDISFIHDASRSPREVRMLTLCELPMVQNQKSLRDEYAMQLLQAYRCTDVRDRLGRSEPNANTFTRFGAITIINASWGNGISDRRVCSEVVADLLPQLKTMLSASRQDVVASSGVKLYHQGVACSSVDQLFDLLKQARGAEPTDFSKQCRETGERPSARFEVQLHDGHSLDLRRKLRPQLPGHLKGAEAFRQRLAILASVTAAIAEHRGGIADSLHRLRREASQTDADLDRAIRLYFPKTIADRFRNPWIKPSDKRIKFHNAVSRNREATRALRNAEVQLKALDEAQARVNDEMTIVQGRIQRMVRLLQPFLIQSVIPESERVTRGAELDSVLAELSSLPDDASEQEVLTVLRCAVQSTTMTGLAKIFDAVEADADQVAAMIANGELETVGPYFGGRLPVDQGEIICVVPPLASEDKADLHAALIERQAEVVLATSESSEAGLNAVMLEVHKPRNWEQVFTSRLNNDLRSALAGGEIYFPNGIDHIAKVGVPLPSEECEASDAEVKKDTSQRNDNHSNSNGRQTVG